jgi:hypothetical protein
MPLKQIEVEREVRSHDLDTVLDFGKYKGMTIDMVMDEDPGYLLWAVKNIIWFDLPVQIADRAGDEVRAIRRAYYDTLDWDWYMD